MFAKLSVTQQPVAADTKAMELSQQEMVDASTLKIGKHFFILIFLFLFFLLKSFRTSLFYCLVLLLADLNLYSSNVRGLHNSLSHGVWTLCFDKIIEFLASETFSLPPEQFLLNLPYNPYLTGRVVINS